jgi:hypothetical protein
MKLEIQSQQDTEVYASDAGYVCISQPNPWGDDSLIILAIHNVDTICQMLQEAKADAVENRNLYLKEKEQK